MQRKRGRKRYNHVIILLGVTAALFASCNSHPNLSKAKELLASRPDSSLAYLRAIPHPEDMAPKDYAEWCLLMAQAKQRTSQSLVPDSFVFKAFDYFAKDTSDPLLTAKNCILTPHISWAPRESRQRIMDTAVENVKAYLAGAPINVVNR